MRSFSKLGALLFAVLLTFVGVQKAGYAPLPQQVLTTQAGNEASPQLLVKQLQDVWGLQQQSEQLVHPGSSFPVPASKLQATDASLSSFLLELRLQQAVSGYLQRAKSITGSLSVRSIIYPFHYFW